MDAVPPFSFASFRESCRDHLTDRDRSAIEFIGKGDPASAAPAKPAFLRRRQALETQLRNALASRRALAAKADVSVFMRPHAGFRVEIEQAVDAAFALQTPLARERAIDGLRWRLLEELGGLDPFTGEAVLAYACRLQISERWAALTVKAGQQRFEAATEKFAEKIDLRPTGGS